VRNLLCALSGALMLWGCGEPPPHPYPEQARMQFEASCPASSAVCRCTWDHITRSMTAEDYNAAVTRFRETGLMDPHITRARTQCVEHGGN
jgi:hypothetical protein